MKKIGKIFLFVLFAIPVPIALLTSFVLSVACLAVLVDPSGFSFAEIALVLVATIIAVSYTPLCIFAWLVTRERKKISLISFAPAVHILVAVLFVLLLNPMLNHWATCYGLRIKDYKVVESVDTHGGFHGDGSYRFILDCSGNRQKALETVKDWNKLPLPQNVQLMMYGGEKDGWHYSYYLAREAGMPKVENGYYLFCDEQSDNSSDDSELLNRGSFNFSLAVYDSDTDMMYYFEYDT